MLDLHKPETHFEIGKAIRHCRKLHTERQAERRCGIDIKYCAPWDDPAVIPRHSVDMILSNTVLQCVENLPAVYAAFDIG